jgi:hypothetical protein
MIDEVTVRKQIQEDTGKTLDPTSILHTRYGRRFFALKPALPYNSVVLLTTLALKEILSRAFPLTKWHVMSTGYAMETVRIEAIITCYVYIG